MQESMALWDGILIIKSNSLKFRKRRLLKKWFKFRDGKSLKATQKKRWIVLVRG